MSGINLLRKGSNKEFGNRFVDLLKQVSQIMTSLMEQNNMEIKKMMKMLGPSSLITLSTIRSNLKAKVLTNHTS